MRTVCIKIPVNDIFAEVLDQTLYDSRAITGVVNDITAMAQSALYTMCRPGIFVKNSSRLPSMVSAKCEPINPSVCKFSTLKSFPAENPKVFTFVKRFFRLAKSGSSPFTTAHSQILTIRISLETF